MIRVLIVDDSAVYRSKIRAALSGAAWIEIVGAVSNGKLALEMAAQNSIDLMTLDMEMPVMNGLQTIQELRKSNRAMKVIVFSSSTVRGSEATLEALASGADDFVTKPGSGGDAEGSPEDVIRTNLLPKIQQFLKSRPTVVSSGEPTVKSKIETPYQSKDLNTFRPSAIVIASSTGGPSAHDVLFNGLRGNLRCPIFIAQHMPPVFTTTFAKRISDHSGLICKEAVHGEEVKNQVYVAPGDFHLTLRSEGTAVFTVLDKTPPRNFVRPAADHLFETAASIYGPKCMGFVLTGMGEDGLQGSKSIKNAKGGIMIQNEASCVVFGMPGAVYAARAYDDVDSLQGIRARLERMAFA